jgi:hypothetical protein
MTPQVRLKYQGRLCDSVDPIVMYRREDQFRNFLSGILGSDLNHAEGFLSLAVRRRSHRICRRSRPVKSPRAIHHVEGWKTYQQKTFDNAKWTTRIFRKETAKHIPEKPGVYAFLIRPGIPLGLDANVLIYIGKAGTSIRKRYYRYLRESIDPVHGRPKITYWLRKYFDYVHFAYAEIPQPGDPHDLEQRLLAALMPPANDQIPGKLRRKRHAFR